MSFGGGLGDRGGGGAVGFLLLVFRVLVRGGCGGYAAGLHGVVGFLRFQGLLVGVWARGPGSQYVLDGREDLVVVVPRTVGCYARPVGGSGWAGGVRQGG